MVHQVAATWVSRAGEGESPPQSEAAPPLAPQGGERPLTVAARSFVRLQQIWLGSNLGNHNGIWSPAGLQWFNFPLEMLVLDIFEVPTHLTYKRIFM